jgi:DNA-binding winged helix-turn-helix (wHTH) protein
MDVRILRWPDQAHEADRLASLGTPRLLIVESGVPPPTETSCLVDWLRLPATNEDMCVRLASLLSRAARHPRGPLIDDCGQLSHRGTTVALSSINEQITKVLLEDFDHPVPAEELVSRCWTDDGTNEALRVHISRLRHRIAPLGLTIANIRGHGYVIREAETPDSMPAPALSPSALTAETTHATAS